MRAFQKFYKLPSHRILVPKPETCIAANDLTRSKNVVLGIECVNWIRELEKPASGI